MTVLAIVLAIVLGLVIAGAFAYMFIAPYLAKRAEFKQVYTIMNMKFYRNKDLPELHRALLLDSKQEFHVWLTTWLSDYAAPAFSKDLNELCKLVSGFEFKFTHKDFGYNGYCYVDEGFALIATMVSSKAILGRLLSKLAPKLLPASKRVLISLACHELTHFIINELDPKFVGHTHPLWSKSTEFENRLIAAMGN